MPARRSARLAAAAQRHQPYAQRPLSTTNAASKRSTGAPSPESECGTSATTTAQPATAPDATAHIGTPIFSQSNIQRSISRAIQQANPRQKVQRQGKTRAKTRSQTLLQRFAEEALAETEKQRRLAYERALSGSPPLRSNLGLYDYMLWPPRMCPSLRDNRRINTAGIPHDSGVQKRADGPKTTFRAWMPEAVAARAAAARERNAQIQERPLKEEETEK